LALANSQAGFTFQFLDLADREGITVSRNSAATSSTWRSSWGAYSLQNPFAYADSNLAGFVNLLEGCRQAKSNILCLLPLVQSGANTKVPFAVSDNVDHQFLYAASKKNND